MMGTSDGKVGSTTNLTGNGFPAWSLVVMGDGYRGSDGNQPSEIGKYHADVDNFITKFFETWPFVGLRRSIDVYRIDVTSTDSGPDDPMTGNCTGTGAVRKTYFDSTFCSGGVPRLLGGNVDTVVATAKNKVPSWGAAIVLVNTTKAGGQANVENRVCFASPIDLDTVIHELGHAGFGLGDEYEYWLGCDSGETDRNNHPSMEPSYPNVTVTKSPLKWAKFVTVSPTPLMKNPDPDCKKCDERKSTLPPDTVGLFEGADSYHCGAYRAQYDCKMRTFGKRFCVVCQNRIINMVAPSRVPAVPFASLHTGWVLDAASAATSGAMIQQFPPHGGANQQFLVEPVPTPEGALRYRIRAVNTSLVLDVVGGSTSPGAPLQLYPWHGGKNQQFVISALGNDYATVRAVHSDLYLEVPDGPPSSGVAVRQATLTATANQKWLPFLNMQPGWRRCRKCQGLFFTVHSNGYCPAGGAHDPSESDAYLLSNNNLLLASWDDNWRWCRRCQGLFRPWLVGRCPAPGGGSHDASLSGGYSLPYNMPPSGAQHHWRHCSEKCGGLFFGDLRGVCPLDQGVHDSGFTGALDYSLARA